ncbi:MAG: hypothetical protein RL226_1352 [Bacteroidota bacterium]|jgi:CRP-like cAMP-binding protein
MTPEEIQHRLLRYVCLSPDEARAFADALETFRFPKKSAVLEAGQLCSHFYWVQSGCLVNFYTDTNGVDHVMQIAIENWWSTDLAAFLNNGRATYRIEAVSEVTLLGLSKSNMDSLLEKHPAFERYFRIIFQNALVSHQRRILQNVTALADERYHDFNRQFPGLEQTVPLKFIAAYLGITPQFLSKLRKRALLNESHEKRRNSY